MIVGRDAWVATLAGRMKYIKHSNIQRKNVASSVENAEDVIVKLNKGIPVAQHAGSLHAHRKRIGFTGL